MATSETARIPDVVEAQPNGHTARIRRSRFWGDKPNDPQLMQKFHANIKDCQFIVVDHSAGDVLMRVDQTMAAGRIPILLDSNPDQPFEHAIDWEGSSSIRSSLERIPQINRSSEASMSGMGWRRCGGDVAPSSRPISGIFPSHGSWPARN